MGAFRLGKMTFGSLFKKPETVLYPTEEKQKPAGLKGHIGIEADACILCGMCQRSCTTGCIAVDRQHRTWAIDRLQCVQCGYCITVCPKACLHMNPDYAPATTVREIDCHNIPDGEKPKGAPPETAQPPASAREALRDAQLETLLALMDAAKAEKVRAAMR